MQRLDEDLPQHQQDEPKPSARHAPAEQPQGALDALAAGLDVAALEGQLAKLADELRPASVSFCQVEGGFEFESGFLVAAAEHEYVAQPLGDPQSRRPISLRGSAAGDAVLLLGDLQRVARPRLVA